MRGNEVKESNGTLLFSLGNKLWVRVSDMVDLNTNHAIRDFLNKIKTQYEFNGALLFGSRAWQTHRADSDVDVAILLSGPAGEFLTTKLAMADMAYDILLETGIHIQPFPL